MKDIINEKTVTMNSVRLINNDDGAALADCLNTWGDDDSWGGSFGAIEYTEKRVYDDWIKDASAIQLLLEENGKIQGYCSYDGHRRDNDAVYVPLLGVRPTEQGKGYGKALLLTVLERAIKDGKRRLDLLTWAGNTRAVPLYKKIGFMWAYNTSVNMENYLPAILQTEFFNDFFNINNHYKSRIFEMNQKHDDYIHQGVRSYYYYFEQDDQNSLRVFVDHWSKELSGFEYIVHGKLLSILFEYENNEVFLGIDGVKTTLIINNETDETIHFTGELIPYKYLKLNNENIDVTVKAGERRTISIKGEIDNKCTTILPEEHFYSRTETRFVAKLKINDVHCQLGGGWLPKEAIKIIMHNKSVDFGKYTDKKKVLMEYRNLTSENMFGEILLSGDGIDRTIPFEVYADTSNAFTVEISRPEFENSIVWKWNIQFVVNGNKLPKITKYVSCFLSSGAVAYIIPNTAAIIENDKYRFLFMLKGANSMYKVESKVSNFSERFYMYGIEIGMPFPESQSEFWDDIDFEVVTKNIGVALKQSYTSNKFKPGLKITRWIELEPSKSFITMYFEMENTTDNTIEKVSVRHSGWINYSNNLHGATIVPSIDGIMYLNDNSFDDELDYPHLPEHFSESWIAVEPYNEIGMGFGYIWDNNDLEKIRYTNDRNPSIYSKVYDIKPKQKIVMGRVSLVIGTPAARTTRNVWIKEYEGESVYSESNGSRTLPVKSLLNINLGEKINNRFNWVNIDDSDILLEIDYLGRRSDEIDIEIGIEGDTLPIKLINHKKQNLVIPNRWNNFTIQKISMIINIPHSKINYYSTLIPYQNGEVTFEKKDSHWELDNGYFKLKTDPNHGASIYSLIINNKDLFFSKYPIKGPFSWFKVFLGGLYPFLHAGSGKEFENEIWSDPVLLKNNNDVGFRYTLCPNSSHNLKKLNVTLTHVTRANSPILISTLEVHNISNTPVDVVISLDLYLKPIKQIVYQWDDQIKTGTFTEKQKHFTTQQPHNWVYINAEENFLFINDDPNGEVSGSYMNAIGYSNMGVDSKRLINPGEKYSISSQLIFGNDLHTLLTKKNFVNI